MFKFNISDWDGCAKGLLYSFFNISKKKVLNRLTEHHTQRRELSANLFQTEPIRL